MISRTDKKKIKEDEDNGHYKISGSNPCVLRLL